VDQDLTPGLLAPPPLHAVSRRSQKPVLTLVFDRRGGPRLPGSRTCAGESRGGRSPSDASTLRIDGPDVYADLSLDDSQDQFMLNVIGGSERLTTVIHEFAARLNARAVDLQTGDWLTVEDGEASFAAWGAYKRRVAAPRPDAP
jgi:hypothetical protein